MISASIYKIRDSEDFANSSGVEERTSFMALTIARFLSLVFAALAMAPALAHLLELPNKINLSHDEYLIVQQIYRGWALLGIVVFGALAFSLLLTIMVQHQPKRFRLALFGFVCIVATQVVFWTFTYPANQQTNNWTMLPENWEALRRQWEYSHAASAGLNFIALIALVLSVLVHDD